jgi:5'/3'-nucleotidase SurE
MTINFRVHQEVEFQLRLLTVVDSSPFILPWYNTLKSLHPDWDISVVIPDSQKSWISKAFHIGEKITATFYDPKTGTTSSKQQSQEDWVLLNGFAVCPFQLIAGTPSTCTNIGLHHVSGEKDFDLVISGPNFGRNSSTVFTLGSGTIGGAMEAALVMCCMCFPNSSLDIKLSHYLLQYSISLGTTSMFKMPV